MRGRYAPPAGSILGKHILFSRYNVSLDRATKRKAAVGSIVVVIILSFFALLDAHRAITGLPQYQDVLVVSVGNDRATGTTSGIITETLAKIQDAHTTLGSENN
ncbi:MAG: hypothetical protein ACFE8Z_06750, partial [Candidatus Hermodarchaeota archaeon]